MEEERGGAEHIEASQEEQAINATLALLVDLIPHVPLAVLRSRFGEIFNSLNAVYEQNAHPVMPAILKNVRRDLYPYLYISISISIFVPLSMWIEFVGVLQLIPNIDLILLSSIVGWMYIGFVN